MTPTKIVLQEDDILKLVLEFLRARRLYKAARVLEKEASVVNCPYSDSITFLRELVLDGEWDALKEFAQPLEDIQEFDCRKFHFLVTKQKYLETLFEKCEGSVRDEHALKESLLSSLILLEKYCSRKDEYHKLYWYLSVPSLRDEPEFSTWNLDLSRMLLFEEILSLLKPFIPLEEQNSSRNSMVSGDRLLSLISKGLLYENCIEFCQKKAMQKTSASDFSLRDIRTDLFRVQSSKSTGNFYSWLHSLPAENFVVPFEEANIEVFVEKQKQTQPRPDIKNNSLSRSLTFESSTPAKHLYQRTRNERRREEKRLSDNLQSKYLGQVDFNFRDVSQSWADFKFDVGNDKRLVLPSDQESVFLENGSAPGEFPADGDDMTTQSPRKTKQYQQDLVFQRLEEHKRKHKELHQQLAEMTAGLEKEGDRGSWRMKDGERSSNINGLIPGGVSASKSSEALRKSKESLRFFNKTPETPKNSTATLSSQPKRTSISEENHTGNDSSKSAPTSATSEPKTPMNTCFPPGLVKLTDGSGAFNTSTPKSHRQAFMTPPPPASPVASEQTAVKDEVPVRQSHQNKVIPKNIEKKSDTDMLNQTPRSTLPGTKQFVVRRSLVNDIKEKQKFIVMPDDTSVKSTTKPVSAASKEMKFQKVAVLQDTQAIRSIAFHPNGNYFAVGTNSKSLKVCSARKVKQNHVPERIDQDVPEPEVVFKKAPIHRGSVYCVAFSPKGDIIATGSNDKLIKLLRFDEGSVQNLCDEMELAIHSATVRDLTFVNSAGSIPMLASGGAGGGLIYLSDCTTGQTVSSLQGHSGNIMTVFASSNQNLLCSGSADKTVRLWDLRVPKSVDMFPSNSCVASVCFNYGTGPIHIASAYENGQCIVYDISAKKALSTFQPHNMDCRTIRYSADSKYILTGSYDSSIVITDIQYDSDCKILLHPQTVARHRDKVIQCRWHPAQYTFVSSSADKTVALWKQEEG